MSFLWPDNKKFAFTIIDDTDNADVANIAPVYALLTELGMKTTKTVWPFPSRNHFRGESLQDPLYLAFIKDLHVKGFEIALHNVGSGHFTRDEITAGLKLFKDLLGCSPDIHINHSSNHDNIYWGYDRYGILLKNVMRLVYGNKRSFYGHDPDSDCFWGDLCKVDFPWFSGQVLTKSLKSTN